MNKLYRLDQKYIWHPFTQMRAWMKQEPIVIVEGEGAELKDEKGRTYLDANSSIWTNLHGHMHPAINKAIRRQLGKISHSSALGFANEPASLLAEKLVRSAKKPLCKVFFSDDGSTALEVALKLAHEFTRRTRGAKCKPKFLSLEGAYHGDTIGAVSLGHIDLFHKAFGGMLFATDKAMAPYCYRCRFNRARPERDDARNYRKCNWECIRMVEHKFSARKKSGNPYAAFVFEPLMQGAAGMIPQPKGWLRRISEMARQHGSLLIADEVMTGFGRVSIPDANGTKPQQIFAVQQEEVRPDFLCIAKGLTGGYLPMAATLTTQKVFDAFLGEYQEFKTFFHGHSYFGNQLGAAAALASLKILQGPESMRQRIHLERGLQQELKTLWSLPQVGDIRQAGLIAGVELVKDWKRRTPFRLSDRAGIRVCEGMARHGVLTRPIGNVIVIMPPYCTTPSQLSRMIQALRDAIQSALQ